MSAASVAQFKSFLTISLGLATVSFGLTLTAVGKTSYWLIPVAWLLTEIHHWGLWFQLGRSPQPQRWFINMYPALMIWWVGGSVCAIIIFAFVASNQKPKWADIAGLVSGIVGILEAGLLGAVWKRAVRLSKETQDAREGANYGLLHS